MGMRKKVVFLDRDGGINKARHHPSGDARNYVTKWEEFEWIPGSKEAIIRLLEKDYLVVVVTNQACIGKKIAEHMAIRHIHSRMRNEIRLATQHLPADKPELLRGYLAANLAFYICPHTVEDRCSCRKPEPGMLYAAAYKWNIHLPSAWMVGDGFGDIVAGQGAGIEKCRHIDPSKKPRSHPLEVAEAYGDIGYPDLSHVVDTILAWDGAETTEETTDG